MKKLLLVFLFLLLSTNIYALKGDFIYNILFPAKEWLGTVKKSKNKIALLKSRIDRSTSAFYLGSTHENNPLDKLKLECSQVDKNTFANKIKTNHKFGKKINYCLKASKDLKSYELIYSFKNKDKYYYSRIKYRKTDKLSSLIISESLGRML